MVTAGYPASVPHYGASSELIDRSLGRTETTPHSTHQEILASLSLTHPTVTLQAMARIKELNIQVDNLCQFLPQDRVVAFAKMNSQNLLMATQKAVGECDCLCVGMCVCIDVFCGIF
ncbi:Structural maintenance of chromosomes protein 5 [Portunus trituberculatus]|uniref:Structural maintenance of chromosomes protein 5 n=1 Tax=Portunus trituberculatus TaxID=210409 RepID=A0A5B7ETM0_PORTR|nr:Structural maintenance of chromosomes protein 5 [Portunus trituberculatus]